MTGKQISWLKDAHDLPGLEKALRHPGDPILRREAAEALGELDNLEAVEMLIRSTLEDPDPDVQKAARSALDDLIGSDAKPAIASYRSAPADDAWLAENSADADEDRIDEEKTSPAGRKISRLKEDHDLTGLEKALRNPGSPDLLRQAALALGQLNDLDAV